MTAQSQQLTVAVVAMESRLGAMERNIANPTSAPTTEMTMVVATAPTAIPVRPVLSEEVQQCMRELKSFKSVSGLVSGWESVIGPHNALNPGECWWNLQGGPKTMYSKRLQIYNQAAAQWLQVAALALIGPHSLIGADSRGPKS